MLLNIPSYEAHVKRPNYIVIYSRYVRDQGAPAGKTRLKRKKTAKKLN